MKLGISIIVSLLLSSCSILFRIQVTDPRTGIEYTVPARLQDVPGIKELAEACATKAGRVVHRTVQVDGYFSHGMGHCEGTCWTSFAQSPYQFIEFEVTEPKSWLFVKEVGLWRMSKQRDGDPRCGAKPTRYVKRISERDGWPVEFCLAFERVESLKSQYETAWIGESKKIENEDVDEISIGRSLIRDRVTKEELGYSVTTTLFLADHFRSNQRSFNCSSLGITPPGLDSGRFLVYDVLK